MNSLKTISKNDSEYRVGNYIVLFGGRDLDGEFFTKNTEFESAYTKSGMLHVDFEHGQDVDQTGMDKNEVLGYVDWKSMRVDDKGVFVERVLSRRARYMDALEPLLEEGLIGTSSEAVAGKVEKTDDGEIVKWPLKRDSLTFTPAEPRMLTANTLRAAKSLYRSFPNSKSLAVVADISLREQIEACKTLSDFEAFMRDACSLSRQDAKTLISCVKSAVRRDDGQEDAELISGIKAVFQGFNH